MFKICNVQGYGTGYCGIHRCNIPLHRETKEKITGLPDEGANAFPFAAYHHGQRTIQPDF
jgi:hypothetical protein